MLFLSELGLFAAKAFIILAIILIILITFFALLSKGKCKEKGKLIVKNLSKKYRETKTQLLEELLSKKAFKAYLKATKKEEKTAEDDDKKTLFVLKFHGDIKASAVDALAEEITAILQLAKPNDEVLLRLESAGGVVHGYGLAAAQLMRLRTANIYLTVAIDKVAASGGYLMACVANKIVAAPFAIIGSIGVIVQLPNFHRLLKDKHIEFEQETAGEYKRTLTLFGENTNEGREKLREEIEAIHQQFKALIHAYRPQVDIQKVATGEHWLAEQTLNTHLVDELRTSDDFLFAAQSQAKIIGIGFEVKKGLLSRMSQSAKAAIQLFMFQFLR